MSDPFTLSLGQQVTFLEGTAVTFATKCAFNRLKSDWPKFFATPVLGPIGSWVAGFIIGKVMKWLMKSADFQAYFKNTQRRADEQAKRFDDLVNARQRAESPEELNRAEDLALKSFDDVVKYSR